MSDLRDARDLTDRGNFWDQLMGTDEAAATYMLTYGEGPGSDTRLILTSLINDGESVLDVGCGPGWNMEHFAQYGPALSVYKGVDYSARFVRVANKRRKERRDENFTTAKVLPFELQDCRALQEPEQSWDVVILQDCLEHTNGFEKPILEALRVARKRVIMTFWHLTEHDDHINDDGDDGYGAWYSRPSVERFLDQLGYSWFETETQPTANRQHIYYIIDKEV